MLSVKKFLLSSALILLASAHLSAKECPSQPTDSTITAVPTRPVITDGADVIQTGTVEFESGWASGWPGGGVRQDSVSSLYKIGLFCNFEFRASTNAFQSQTNPNGSAASGMGDIWYSGQYRFFNHTKSVPSLALIYATKQATASESKGLGSGQTDHLVAIAAAKPLGKMTWSFESKWIFSGRTTGNGFDKNAELSFNLAYPLSKRVGLISEIYGDTQKNPATPAFASNLWALQYSVNSRLILDSGVDLGITNGAPHKRIFIGVSYALGDIYIPFRHHPAPIGD